MPETNAECMLTVLETWSAEAGGKGLQTQSAASGEMPAEMPRSRLDLGHRSGQSMKAGALFMQAALYSAPRPGTCPGALPAGTAGNCMLSIQSI